MLGENSLLRKFRCNSTCLCAALVCFYDALSFASYYLLIFKFLKWTTFSGMLPPILLHWFHYYSRCTFFYFFYIQFLFCGHFCFDKLFTFVFAPFFYSPVRTSILCSALNDNHHRGPYWPQGYFQGWQGHYSICRRNRICGRCLDRTGTWNPNRYVFIHLYLHFTLAFIMFTNTNGSNLKHKAAPIFCSNFDYINICSLFRKKRRQCEGQTVFWN